jgi:hypothetical protein
MRHMLNYGYILAIAVHINETNITHMPKCAKPLRHLDT